MDDHLGRLGTVPSHVHIYFGQRNKKNKKQQPSNDINTNCVTLLKIKREQIITDKLQTHITYRLTQHNTLFEIYLI